MAKKAVICGTSLAAIFFSSVKLVLACSLPDGSTFIENNKSAAQLYFALSLIALAAVSYWYFARKKRGLIIVVLSFVILLLHPALRFGGGGKDCGEFYAESAKWLFGLSLLCFTTSNCSSVKEKKSSQRTFERRQRKG